MSEFSLIAQHFSRHQATNDIAISVGDDCAVVDVPVGQQLVICTDTMVANRHYPSDTPAAAGLPADWQRPSEVVRNQP